MTKKRLVALLAVCSVITAMLTTLFFLSPQGRAVYATIAQRIGASPAAKLMKIESIVDSVYMGEYDKNWLTDKAAYEYAASVGDKYTLYLNAADFESMQENLDGGYRGIGIQVGAKDGKVLIDSVMKASPAEAAGLLSGDFIVSVNDVSYTSEDLSEVVSAIKEVPPGESVKLGIERAGELIEKNVIVSDVELEYVKSTLLDGGVGFVRVDTFGNDVSEKFKSHINALIETGATSLIIDLRSNPGGALDTVVDMVDFLVPEGIITTVKDRNGNEEVYSSDKSEINLPMCVLINENSASASEIMAAALSDYGKATLVGKNTYGKGVVQGVYSLGDGTGLRVTIARYYTPAGQCIDGKGVAPDAEVDLPDGISLKHFDATEEGDTQLEKAIDILKNK
ncbi:MAG: S41 family peptidase [Clostridia bacterium]|nr:S41 family peptidase [Clostridia bacterium]